MKKIVLISCVKKKRDRIIEAKNLYISNLFRRCFSYAQSLNPDAIYILSAKYHLLDCEREVAPYELTLNNMKSQQIKEWAEIVLNQLQTVADLQNDQFVFLAGEKYRKYLVQHIRKYGIPMKGLSIGMQLAWLKKELSP